MSSRSQQLLFVFGAIALTVVLYFAPKKVEKMASAETKTSTSFEAEVTKAKQGLKREEAEAINLLEKKVKDNPGDLSLVDSLAGRWDALQQPAVSAHYHETV